MTPSEIIWKARDHVAAGWCQNEWENESGNVCAVAALHKAVAGSLDRRIPAASGFLEAYEAVAVAASAQPWALAGWNNLPTTTAQDVMDAMEKAAITMEEVGK